MFVLENQILTLNAYWMATASVLQGCVSAPILLWLRFVAGARGEATSLRRRVGATPNFDEDFPPPEFKVGSSAPFGLITCRWFILYIYLNAKLGVAQGGPWTFRGMRKEDVSVYLDYGREICAARALAVSRARGFDPLSTIAAAPN